MNRFLKLLLDCISKSGNQEPSYEELLKRREWKDKRLKILKRDSFKCRCCHKRKDPLQAHHLYYLIHEDGRKALPWEYEDSALITLCRDCHKRFHELYKPEWKRIK